MAAVCGIYKKEDQSNIPVEWCPECQKALCSPCSQRHKQDKSSKDHEIMASNNYHKLPPFIKNINQNCSNHTMKYQFLCREHDTLICNKCIKTEHKKCKEIPYLPDIVGKVKTSNAFEDVAREMKEAVEILRNGIAEQQKNLKGFQNQRKEMARKVEDTMARIMTYLMKVKQNMLSDIDVVIKEEEGKGVVTQNTLQTMENQISEIYNQKESIKSYATNLQTFIGIKEMEKVVEESKSVLTELSDNGTLCCTNIALKEINAIEDMLTKEKLFGYIEATKSPSSMSIETCKPQQAHIIKYTMPKQLQFQERVKVGHRNHFGCCTLPSGIMVVNDYFNDRIKNFNQDGTMTPTIKVMEKPYDIAVVNDNQVVISLPWKASISLVDVNNEKIIKTWSSIPRVAGISYTDGDIIFCVSFTGIKRLNINNKTINDVINDKTVSTYSHAVATHERLYYSCSDSTYTVTVLDSGYNIIFKYQDKAVLRFPWGVTIDNYNNVYVTGYWTHNLLEICPDGKVNQLLSEDDGLYNPTAVHYNCHTKQFIVVVRGMKIVHKYSLG